MIAMLSSPYFPSTEAKCSSKILKVSTVPSNPTYFELYREVCHRKPLLIQEIVAGDPWKLLVAVTFLNKTSGKIAIPVFWNVIARWPTPLMLSRVDENELIDAIQHLGTQNIRAKRLVLLSRAYLQDPPSFYDLRPSKPGVVTLQLTKSTESSIRQKTRYPPTPISHLPGTGPYALDSYRIFCTLHHDPSSNEWQNVTPTDKELIRFLKWKWAVAEHRQWSATSGLGGTATTEYLVSLISDLTSLN